jgi:hypothetical protein
MVTYSTITIDSLDLPDEVTLDTPVPAGLIGPPGEITPALADPEGLIAEPTDGEDTPVLGDPIGPPGEVTPEPGDSEGLIAEPTDGEVPVSSEPAFVIAVHAVNPTVGSPEGDPATAPSTIIGLQVRAEDSYEDIEVPIFPTLQVFGPNLDPDGSILQPGQTFPPNPDGDTEVAVTLWQFVGSELGLQPKPITVDGNPIQDSAIVTALDQNESVPYLEQTKDGLEFIPPDDGEQEQPPEDGEVLT